jgi:biopolymer transport protein ExbD
MIFPAPNAGEEEDSNMAMTSGGPGGLSHDINVTPLIDVLLVLLIIFMVIVPVTPRGLNSQVPQPPKNKQEQQPNDLTIVVSILARPGGGQPSYMINQEDVAYGALYNRLEAIYATRAEKVMFVKGDDDVYYEYVAQVVDLATKAGVDTIGLITPKVEAGQ